jgi:hypothetical protein
MNWHTVTVSRDELSLLVVGIRLGGGTITSCCPCPDGVCVTYTSDEADPVAS